MKIRIIFSILSCFLIKAVFAEQQAVECQKNKVCQVVSTQLPLLGLPRPFTKIYKKADAKSMIITDNSRAFYPLYIYQRQNIDLSDATNPQGWYHVGTKRRPFGWIKAKDLIEWKQALVVSYTPPGQGDERRNPVLMFNNKETLINIIESDDFDKKAENLYKGLNNSPVKVPDSLVSSEPNRFVSIQDKFYLLPIIDFEKIDVFEDDALLLQVVAATPGSRADENKPDTVKNTAFTEQVLMEETLEGENIKDLNFDIVFVMDLTNSMGPYIESTKRAIRKVAAMISHKHSSTHIKYGLVGYRDNVKLIPKLGFTAKNFTPKLVTGEVFDKVIANVKAAEVGSLDYQEEVFAGVNMGVKSAWSENSFKTIILVGDASSHLPNHKQSTTNTTAGTLRDTISAAKINIIALHLKNKRAKLDHALATRQFSTLSKNPGAEKASYYPINTDDKQAYEKATKEIAISFSNLIDDINKKGLSAVKNIIQKQDKKTGIGSMVQSIVANELIRYLGKAANPPRDLTVWVMDRDLVDPAKKSLEVRVLVKKKDLNSLIISLETILEAYDQAKATNKDFFNTLQAVAAQVSAGKDRVTLSESSKLGKSGLLPNWINGLPYKSKLLDLDEDKFSSLSASEKTDLIDRLDGLVSAYKEINESTQLWISLDDKDDSLEHVYPLVLGLLP